MTICNTSKEKKKHCKTADKITVENLFFAMWLDFKKIYFDIFKSEFFFSTGSSTYLEIWVTMREISSFHKSLSRRGGGVNKYVTPSLLNPRIVPCWRCLLIVLHFGTASMCSALIYENHQNFETNIYCQNWNPIITFYLFLFSNDIQSENVHN